LSTSTNNGPQSGADIIRQFLPTSPYVGHLGIRLTDMQPGVATLTLPFADSLVTIGHIVHGGAIASLIDTAAMVAAWSTSTLTSIARREPSSPRAWSPTSSGERACVRSHRNMPGWRKPRHCAACHKLRFCLK